MLTSTLSIAAGGAIGAVLRHLSNIGAAALFGSAFPYGTLFVNIAGSFVMGILVGLFAHLWQAPQDIKLFLTTGLLGGFTTFSAFSLDAITLFERGEIFVAGLYIIASVLFAILAVFAGLGLIRWSIPL